MLLVSMPSLHVVSSGLFVSDGDDDGGGGGGGGKGQ